jgi:serine/threonine protein phosphatase PrpC
MNDNYYANQELINAINNPNYIYTTHEKNSFGSNNITNATNSSSQEGAKTLEENTDESFGIEEVPPKDEDFDHLQKFNLDNKTNFTKRIPHFPYTSSFPHRNNRPISGRIPHPRKTNGFMPYNQNSFEFRYNPNKRNASGEKRPERQTQSKYSSVSENKYNFIHRLSGNEFGLPIFTEQNIPIINNGPVNTIRTIKAQNDKQKTINNLNLGQKIYQYNTNTNNTNYNIINNTNTYSNIKNRENRFLNMNNKTTSNYSYNTIDSSKLQNNIQLVRINQNKNDEIQNKVLNKNKIIPNYDLSSQDNDIMEYYPMDNKTYENYQNKYINNNVDLGPQRLTVGYKFINNVNPNPFFGKISSPQQANAPNNNIIVNQTKDLNSQQKQKKIANVTKISSTVTPFVNNNHFSQVKNQHFDTINNTNEINDQYLNINDYISSPPTTSTIVPSGHIIDNNISNNYTVTTNNYNEENIDLLIDQNNYNNTYNKPESARVTITNTKINDEVNLEKELVDNTNNNNNIDLVYDDFDNSGYVKNYGMVTHPGKDSSGITKTNQDSFVCKMNINNIKDFNIFGVLDGHGPDGHFVSEFVSEFILSKIVDHPNIKNLKDTEKIYMKLKENNCKLINLAFRETDEQLKNFEFDTLESGCTCCLVIHIGKHIICANTGDSRAIVVYDRSNNGNSQNLEYLNCAPLSIDYKPELPDESRRILMAGGAVHQMKNEFGEFMGPFRVWIRGKDYPGLAMSRSIGDQHAKSVGVIPDPGIMEYTLSKSTKYIITCSDGVWEFLNNQTVMNIGKKFYLNNDASSYCHELISKATFEWETHDEIIDDITAVVAFF